MYRETKIAPWFGGLLIAGFLLAVFVPWVLTTQELYRQEALFAVQASEINLLRPVVTLHHVAIRNAYPLFPALAAVLTRYCGIAAETSLRLLSFFFLCAGTVLVYFAASNGSGKRAGLVASAMYCSTFLMMEKGIEGTAGTMNAFWVLAAQMSFFYFGLRQGKWNLAWCSAGALLLAGCYSGGLMVLLFFVAPMFFFRRPLAGRAKFHHWGFVAALVLIGVSLLVRGVVYWSLERRSAGTLFWWRDLSFGEYLRDIALYGFYLMIRLMPWSFIAWIPFCVALQAIDPKPLFSKYLRTQVFTSAALLWLLPKLDMQEKFYLLGNLSILCGIYYDLGMRRYGEKLRPVLAFLAEYLGFAVAALFLSVMFVDETQLSRIISIGNTLNFRNEAFFAPLAWTLIGLLIAVSLLIHFLRKRLPVWLILFAGSAMAGAFVSGILCFYRAQEMEKRTLGKQIKKCLNDQSVKLYKCDIRDLYGELFYSGCPVYKISSADEVPDTDNVVYLLSTEFPQNPKRHWVNLLPEDFLYRKHRLMLWRGKLNTTEKSAAKPPFLREIKNSVQKVMENPFPCKNFSKKTLEKKAWQSYVISMHKRMYKTT